ncbi:hypothetical protein DQ04_04931010 [Trypanosoma grayi]|uniref:hypothetical protein n=1 Tax=Trypanosoma grayi TaxID=71804 RepID=UPI0004F431A5|nr:hypothetical protein DQ04_04931010 [Trypanosoma grayi]KEG09620.1 hypothetical protein DQ04_04931010 [Trypanosoma grayi]
MESKKNAHRLNRIFRKPRATVAPRSWHEEGDGAGPYNGVSLSLLNELASELTDVERSRAAAAQDPPPVVQEELAKRAARFGLPVAADNVGDAGVVVDDAALQKRMERFGTVEAQPQELNEAMQKRMARFGAAPAPTELNLSAADRELMERRQNRFAT